MKDAARPDAPPTDIMAALAALIHARRLAPPDASTPPSYTRQLLDAGPERCARKFGEEAVEAIVAALSSATHENVANSGKQDAKQALTAEAADVLYHLLVLLESRDVAWQDVAETLARRMGTSGIAEKAARTK